MNAHDAKPLAAAPSTAGSEQVPQRLIPFSGGWRAHRNRHCIWIVTPQNYTHSHAFDEVALALRGAFHDLGGSAPIVTDMNKFGGRAPIIYGGNLLPAEILPRLPRDTVLVNLEQVSAESEWINSRYLAILQNLPVLDYSPRNCKNLAAKGITHARVMEIGYSALLTQIKQTEEKDVDVLFYGSLNQRRIDVLEALQRSGLKVAHLFNVYGAERDAAIARAKVVINIHHYESGVFEIVRVSYLLANRVCVLTEGDAGDPDLEPFIGGLAIEPYHGMIERCHQLIADAGERDAIAATGFAAMQSRSQADMLMSVMKAAA